MLALYDISEIPEITSSNPNSIRLLLNSIKGKGIRDNETLSF